MEETMKIELVTQTNIHQGGFSIRRTKDSYPMYFHNGNTLIATGYSKEQWHHAVHSFLYPFRLELIYD